MDWSLLFSSYASVFLSPQVLLTTPLGATGGVLQGAIPGMTATMGVALLILPLRYGPQSPPSVFCCSASAAACAAAPSPPS